MDFLPPETGVVHASFSPLCAGVFMVKPIKLNPPYDEIDKLHRLLDEAKAVVGAGVLRKQEPKKLDELLLACRRWISSNPQNRNYESTIAALQQEIDRRKLEDIYAEETQRHNQLKTAVDALRRPHQLHWWLLAVAILTAIFAGISAWPVISDWIQGH